MVNKLEAEIDLFSTNFWDWVDNWFPTYFIFDDSYFKKDVDLYFPFFLTKCTDSNFIEKNNQSKIIDFTNCKFNSNRNLNGNHEKLYKWKFGSRNWNTDREKIFKINEIADVNKIYGDDALVALIYWTHVFEPLQYPIFDQRVLRSFLLLSNIEINNDKNFLWLKGVPSGKKLYDFYENHYKSYILGQIDSSLSAKEKFINLRLIDWALFGFDTYVTSESIGKLIQIDKTIKLIISDKLNGIILEKWSIKK